VILKLYRRRGAGEINFVGTIATIAGSDNFDRDRHCRAARESGAVELEG
jgi:hypothetical protein